MTLLAADWLWFKLIPGFDAANEAIAGAMGTSWIGGTPVTSVYQVFLSMLATAIIILFVMLTRASWAKGEEGGVVPEGRFSIPNFVETVVDGVLGLGEQVFGNRKDAERFLPLIGTLALYIFINNALGLVPGFAPATDSLNTNIGPALVVFFVTHFYGLKENGLHYLEHFLGPKIGGFWWLAPLFIIIEVISHLVRPISLALRLMGNMMGDHMVIAIFLGLAAVPLFFPIPVLILGTVVVTVQALVFCLLSMVYIALAIEHSEEAH
jgi:F-type H+-transporting ATPase subunit a